MSYQPPHPDHPETYLDDEKHDAQPFHPTPPEVSPLPPPPSAITHGYAPPPPLHSYDTHARVFPHPSTFVEREKTPHRGRGSRAKTVLGRGFRLYLSMNPHLQMAICTSTIMLGIPLVALILTLIGCALADSAGVYKGLPKVRFCGAAFAMGLILGILPAVLACICVPRGWLQRWALRPLAWLSLCASVFALPLGLHTFRWFSAYRGHTGFLIIAAALGIAAFAMPVVGLVYSVGKEMSRARGRCGKGGVILGSA